MLVWLTLACAPDLTPAWAIDPWWAEPAAEGGLHGFQTWMLYGPRYAKNRSDRSYVCSVVVEFTATPSAPCPGCTSGWAVAPALAESDCDEAWTAEPAWLTLTAIGVGPVPEALAADDPHPGTSMGSYADYGDGWLSAGWVWPEATETSATTAAWTGGDPAVFWPAYAWELPAAP